MSVRRAGVLAAWAAAAVLSAVVAVAGVLMGGLDAIEAIGMLLGLAAVLVVPATFTGWVCAPRLADAWPGRLAACAMAALTASASTAVCVWVALLSATLAIDIVRERLDPASWSPTAVGGWVLFYGIATSIVLVISLIITIPLAIFWEWLAQRLLGREARLGSFW